MTLPENSVPIPTYLRESLTRTQALTPSASPGLRSSQEPKGRRSCSLVLAGKSTFRSFFASTALRQGSLEAPIGTGPAFAMALALLPFGGHLQNPLGGIAQFWKSRGLSARSLILQ